MRIVVDSGPSAGLRTTTLAPTALRLATRRSLRHAPPLHRRVTARARALTHDPLRALCQQGTAHGTLVPSKSPLSPPSPRSTSTGTLLHRFMHSGLPSLLFLSHPHFLSVPPTHHTHTCILTPNTPRLTHDLTTIAPARPQCKANAIKLKNPPTGADLKYLKSQRRRTGPHWPSSSVQAVVKAQPLASTYPRPASSARALFGNTPGSCRRTTKRAKPSGFAPPHIPFCTNLPPGPASTSASTLASAAHLCSGSTLD